MLRHPFLGLIFFIALEK